MADFISRETALACVCQDCSERKDCLSPCVDYRRIKDIPAADVRPVVRAFWVGEMDGVGICSNCKRLDHIDPLATHCRYCGAEITEPQTLKNASQNADADVMMPAT